jgi:hypothetical protein
MVWKEDERVSQEEWIESYFKYSPRYLLPGGRPQDPSLPSLHLLPDDCLDLVFSYLSFEELVRVCHVCKRWYNGCLFAFSRRGDRLFMFMMMKYINTRYSAERRRCRAITVS